MKDIASPAASRLNVQDVTRVNDQTDTNAEATIAEKTWLQAVKQAGSNLQTMSGAAIYTGVSRIIASPSSLMENAERFKSREARRLGLDAQSEYARDAAVHRIIRHYGRLAGATSGGTALTGVVPGVGTAAALTLGIGTDMVITLKLQVEMSMQIAHLYGSDIATEEQKHLAFMLGALGATANAGQEAVSKAASTALVRLTERHLRGASLLMVKAVFRSFGLVFTRRAVVKAIPFGVGAAVGFLTGKAITKKVGHEIVRFYSVPADIEAAPEVIDLHDEDVAAVIRESEALAGPETADPVKASDDSTGLGSKPFATRGADR